MLRALWFIRVHLNPIVCVDSASPELFLSRKFLVRVLMYSTAQNYVSYHLSSPFSRDVSRFSRDASHFS